MPIKNRRKLLAVVVGIAVFILFFIGDSNKYTSLSFLVLPFILLVLILLPVWLAPKFSEDLGIGFIHLHKFFNKNKGLYTFESTYLRKESSWKFMLKVTALDIAIFYNILHLTGNLQPAFSDFNAIRLSIDTILFSLIVASIVNVTIYILTRTGLMFETFEDKSRINLGREFSNRFNWAVSPTVILTLGYYIVTKSNLAISIPEITEFVCFCLFSAFFGFLFLRKWYLEKMVSNLTSRLNKLLNI